MPRPAPSEGRRALAPCDPAGASPAYNTHAAIGLLWALLFPRIWKAALNSSFSSIGQRATLVPDWPQNAGLCLLGTAALLLGVLVYLNDRTELPPALIDLVSWLSGQRLSGSAGLWLPSQVHPLAFSLMTVAALPASGAPRCGECDAWGTVNVGLELGQHAALRVGLAQGLQDLLGDWPAVRWLGAYFLHGTFDASDLLAAVGSALVAAAVLGRFQLLQEQAHGP